MTAIVGGLGAAILWAIATLASSRSSRLIGSRVVLGLHYPSDVLAGGLLGAIIGSASAALIGA